MANPAFEVNDLVTISDGRDEEEGRACLSDGKSLMGVVGCGIVLHGLLTETGHGAQFRLVSYAIDVY